MALAMTTSSDPVEVLIQEFVSTFRDAQTSVWRLWELASSVFEVGGPAGLHRLADASHYQYTTLRRWVSLLPRFPAALRAQFPTLSPELFRTADWGRRQFAEDLPEASLTYWLQLTVTERLSRDQLRARILKRRDAIQWAQNPSAARQRHLIRLADRADAMLAQIHQLAEQFNQKYAAYALCTVTVSCTPLPLP